jgi:hypothetical protein
MLAYGVGRKKGIALASDFVNIAGDCSIDTGRDELPLRP